MVSQSVKYPKSLHVIARIVMLNKTWKSYYIIKDMTK